jgi:hypothetical protein
VVTPILQPSKGIFVLRHAHADLILNSFGGSGLRDPRESVAPGVPAPA